MTRLLLEGLVVIASILIAFAIDAWWDGRGDRQAEQALLSRLHADFTALRPELASVDEEHKMRRDACVSILEKLSVGDTLPTTPEMDRLVAYAFIGARSFQPGTGAVDVFTNGDGARLVQNQRIADLMLAWSGLVEELREEERSLEKGATERWVPYLASRTTIAPYLAVFEDRVADLRLLPESSLLPGRRTPLVVDDVFLNHVIERFQFQSIAIRDIEPLRDAVQEILELLEQEIGLSR